MSGPRIRCLKPRLAEPTNPGGWQSDEVRGNRHQRGYGAAWERTRERIFERDHGLCQEHLKQGIPHAPAHPECDHVVSKAEAKARGWSEQQIDDDSNLQTLCPECHRAKTSRESRRGAG
jgi:5-methylcytosine-specific restriction protein A